MTETPTMPAEPKTKTQRVHADIIAMLRVIEAAHEVSTNKPFKVVEYIDGMIRPTITRDYRAALATLNRESKRGPRAD